MKPLLAAGYQGPTSILTRALSGFVDDLNVDTPFASIHPDVTQAGETARALFDSVEAGHRQVCYLASGYLAHRVPLLSLLDLPFAVSRREGALAALHAEVGEALAAAVLPATGLRVLGFWDNGFRHLSNDRHAIRSPDDCRGLKVRTLDSADSRATMAALGFEAVSIDVRDLVRAVANREVDAQENPLTNFVNFGLWKHHRHVSLTGHQLGICLFVCNGKWFESLSSGMRERVIASAAKATKLQLSLAVKEDGNALEFLARTDVSVLPAEAIDRDAMRQHCEPFHVSRRMELDPVLVERYLSAGASRLKPDGSSTS